jgi:hypothetical protein
MRKQAKAGKRKSALADAGERHHYAVLIHILILTWVMQKAA